MYVLSCFIHKVKHCLHFQWLSFCTALRQKKKESVNKQIIKDVAHLLADGVDISSRDLVGSGHICTSVKDDNTVLPKYEQVFRHNGIFE